MHEIEPYYNWRNLYISSEDERSPFYGREYSEFEYTDRIYDYVIHPQWDSIGSPTLYLKILYADYEERFAIIELMGEWNDCINNDVMLLKRDIVDHLIYYGINKFILLGENILNFHSSDECYYEEWHQDLNDGWIAIVNFRSHVLSEMARANILYSLNTFGEINQLNWRSFSPLPFYQKVKSLVCNDLNFPLIDQICDGT